MSVLYVPATRGSELASRVAKVLYTLPSLAGLKPRVQEVPGRSVTANLTNLTPSLGLPVGGISTPGQWEERTAGKVLLGQCMQLCSVPNLR